MASAIRFRVTGVVQGVNFRQSTVSEAQALRLRGWVRNEPDGAVAGEAGGPAPEIQKLREYLKHGPAPARVDTLDVTELDVDPAALPSPFEVRRG